MSYTTQLIGEVKAISKIMEIIGDSCWKSEEVGMNA